MNTQKYTIFVNAHAIDNHQYANIDELISLLQKIKKDYGDEHFIQVVTDDFTIKCIVFRYESESEVQQRLNAERQRLEDARIRRRIERQTLKRNRRILAEADKLEQQAKALRKSITT